MAIDNNEDGELKEVQLNVTLSYPNSSMYEYFSGIETIDFDKECQRDIDKGKGFFITAPKATTKKNLKDPDGIYSPKFGQKFGDVNPFQDRYSCECGHYKGRAHHGMICPVCNKPCIYVDDAMDIYGWIVLKDEYHIIHPKFYNTLEYIFGNSKYGIERKPAKGTRLENILHYSPDTDEDGHNNDCSFKPDKEPYYGIGMMEFYERFDEILNFYIKLYPKKQKYYDEIMRHRDIIFCHSIPVYTTNLRPVDVRDGTMRYEPSNSLYTVLVRHVHAVNNNKRRMDNVKNIKEDHLFKVQYNYMKLTKMILDLLSGKKGQLRMLVGGRHNFTSRCVIRQNSTILRCDQILLPYTELVKVMQQRIINVLIRTYNITPSEAYDIWSKALVTKDKRICDILDAMIKSDPSGEGLPCLINRNYESFPAGK